VIDAVAWAAAPWVRSEAIARTGRSILRYRAMLAEGAPEVAAEHPAWRLERRTSTRVALEQRLAAMEAELRELRAAAPLPPPSNRPDRRAALARADLLFLLTEVARARRAERDAAGPRLLEVAAAAVAARHGLELDEVRALIGLGCEACQGERSAADGGWVSVGRAVDLPEGRARRVVAFGRPVALFRSGGRVFAIGAVCPHREGPLDQGWVKEGAVVCPHHGWCFELATGRRVGGPGAVESFLVRVEGGELWIAPRGPDERGPAAGR
jgi:nitrite reductase (NADH) small subunit